MFEGLSQSASVKGPISLGNKLGEFNPNVIKKYWRKRERERKYVCVCVRERGSENETWIRDEVIEQRRK